MAKSEVLVVDAIVGTRVLNLQKHPPAVSSGSSHPRRSAACVVREPTLTLKPRQLQLFSDTGKEICVIIYVCRCSIGLIQIVLQVRSKWKYAAKRYTISALGLFDHSSERVKGFCQCLQGCTDETNSAVYNLTICTQSHRIAIIDSSENII